MWSVWWQLRWEGLHRVPKCTAGADGAQASHMQETRRLVRAHAHGFPYSSQFVILPSAFFSLLNAYRSFSSSDVCGVSHCKPSRCTVSAFSSTMIFFIRSSFVIFIKYVT